MAAGYHHLQEGVKGYWVELHRFYLRCPGQCKPCSCSKLQDSCECPSYVDLWSEYVDHLVATGQLVRARRRTIRAAELSGGELERWLPGWFAWALQLGKSAQQLELCKGPDRRVQLFDRAKLDEIKLTGSKLETKNKAIDSVVVANKGGMEYTAGRVHRFLKHIPPGYEEDLSYDEQEQDQELAQIAFVDWYRPASKSPQGSGNGLTAAALDPKTGLPVVKRTTGADPLGNFWCCHHFEHGKFGLAAAPSRRGDLVILSRNTIL